MTTLVQINTSIFAEGLAVSEAAKQHGTARAHAHIDRLVSAEMAVA